jgi:acetyl esterase
LRYVQETVIDWAFTQEKWWDAMAVDPQVQMILDVMATLPQREISEETPEQFRDVLIGLASIKGPVANAARTEDLVIPGPGGEIPVRVYRPESRQLLPVIVYFHGGGFVGGNIATHDGVCHGLSVGVPAVVVSVDYRLAPESPFPAAVDDCEAAVRWVSDHAEQFGAIASRLAVAGDSAGGNLAAVVARRARDSEGPSISFQLLIYPCTDVTCSQPSQVENGEGYLLTGELMQWFYGHYLAGADPRDPDLSPLLVEDLKGLPPALIITAEFDPLRDEGEAYATRLIEAGVSATSTRYDGMIHAFFGMSGTVDAADQAMSEAVLALRKAIG